MRRFFHEGGLPPVAVDLELSDDRELAGGVRVVHVPGASAGQVALVWSSTLIAGDALSNTPGFGGHQFGYEDGDAAVASMRKLLSLSFDNAVFGHGKPIVGEAATRLRRTVRP